MNGHLIHLQVGENGVRGDKQFVRSEERFRENNPAVGRIIEGAFEQRVGGIIPGDTGE